MLRTITVKGLSRKEIPADQIRIVFYPSGKNKILRKAMEQLEKKTAAIKTALRESGFDIEELRMKKISIDENTNKKGQLEYYVVNQELVFRLEMDLERGNTFIGIISEYEDSPDITISYEIMAPEKIEVALSEEMTKDAMRKAEKICSASGSKLGRLIQYSFDKESINKYYPEIHLSEMERFKSVQYKRDFSLLGADDICFETVGYFIWEIAD